MKKFYVSGFINKKHARYRIHGVEDRFKEMRSTICTIHLKDGCYTTYDKLEPKLKITDNQGKACSINEVTEHMGLYSPILSILDQLRDV